MGLLKSCMEGSLCVPSWVICGAVQDWAAFHKGFDRTLSRGPDESRVLEVGRWLCWAFHRLAIMGLDAGGHAALPAGRAALWCATGSCTALRSHAGAAGEERATPSAAAATAKSCCRCTGSTARACSPMLDAEFALHPLRWGTGRIRRRPGPHRHPAPVLWLRCQGGDRLRQRAQEPGGPGAGRSCPFPPGHYYQGGAVPPLPGSSPRSTAICRRRRGDSLLPYIREKLMAGVEKRLVADAKVGFLLSGGLDSSLVCAIAARKSSDSPSAPLPSAWSRDAIDLKYARQVADYIGSHHTEVYHDAARRSSPPWRRSSSCWAPMTSPPSGPAWACTWCARPSTSTRTSGCC